MLGEEAKQQKRIESLKGERNKRFVGGQDFQRFTNKNAAKAKSF